MQYAVAEQGGGYSLITILSDRNGDNSRVRNYSGSEIRGVIPCHLAAGGPPPPRCPDERTNTHPSVLFTRHLGEGRELREGDSFGGFVARWRRRPDELSATFCGTNVLPPAVLVGPCSPKVKYLNNLQGISGGIFFIAPEAPYKCCLPYTRISSC